MVGPGAVLAQWTVAGRTIGLETPLALLLLPVALGLVGLLVLRRRPDVPTSRRSRYAMFGTRVLVLSCLVVAAAGPYVVSTTTTVADPRVTMLIDRSASMDVFDADADRLAAAIEAQGIPVSRTVVGTGNDSRIGDGVVATAESGGNVLLVSDGRVTSGRSLQAAAEFARRVNATVSTVDLGTPATERAVRLAAPPKTTVGVSNTFRVSVDGVEAAGSVPVSVAIDGQTVLSTTIEGTDGVEFTHTFERTGVHRIEARIDTADRIDANDVSYRTVGVVERPSILYVSRGEYPFADLLSELYDVTRASSVPATLDQYTAVVLQDLRAADVGNLDALRSFVVEGNGLLVAGGENAFENGGYAESPLASLLPVQPGEASTGGATVVLTVDVSGSTADGMIVQKALALDVLDQLDDDDQVGIVAFDSRAYLVSPPQSLGTNRALLEDRISRLLSGGGTSIESGLRGAGDVLGQAGGNVVLLTDGLDNSPGVIPAARALAEDDVRIITVGVGARVNEDLLRSVAREAGGAYLRASETSRLRVLFGDAPRTPGSGLTVVDSSHFVTSGIEPRANPSETHDVTIKQGADFLVAAGDGTPALATWRYGLGRVVTVTAYGSDGTLDGLLASPDSLLLSRSVNWIVGDPERKSTGLVSLADTRLGEPTRAVYLGDERPAAEDLRFSQVRSGRYEATVVPTTQGFGTVLDRSYAVDYPVEVSAFGEDPTLERAVELTGGRRFSTDQAAAIAEFVRRRATVVRTVRTDWAWPFLAVAIAVYLADVGARRLQLYGPGDAIEV